MPAIQPLINGLAMSWASATINVLGRDVVGVTGINYDDETQMEDLYGAGQMPVARAEGQYKANASIVLRVEEIVAIQNAAPNGRLQDIPPFDIVVKYIPKDASTIVTDIIKNCQFMTNGRAVKTGDKSIETDLKLITSHIVWGKK